MSHSHSAPIPLPPPQLPTTHDYASLRSKLTRTRVYLVVYCILSLLVMVGLGAAIYSENERSSAAFRGWQESAAKSGASAEQSAWHAIGSKVYHNDPRCTEGNNIEPQNRILGFGEGLQWCDHCARLRVSLQQQH